MKPEEAISAIKSNMPTKGTYTILAEGLELAIQALEKQIPKKPNAYKDEYEHEFAPLCPTCEDWLVSAGEGHCSKCGQAIRWED